MQVTSQQTAMSPDPSQYAVFSMVADAILSATLIFLWLIQRQEKHALCWGVGQLAIMAGTGLLFLPAQAAYLPPQLPQQLPQLLAVRAPLTAMLLSLALGCYWTGTRYFVGRHPRGRPGQTLLAFALLTLALQLLWSARPALMVPSCGVLLGLMLVWAGVLLARGRHQRYRLLGTVLALRGLFNLAGATQLEPDNYLYWFSASTMLKTASLLGLVFAVLDEIRQRYAHTIDSLSNGFLIRDRSGYVHVANERCARLLGYGRAADIIGQHVCDLLPGLTRQSADRYFARFDDPRVQFPLTEEATFRLHNGVLLPVEMIGSPYVERGRLYALVQLLDISERHKKDAQLLAAARIDPITGYCNRHALSQRLAQEVAAAAAQGEECAVLFIDLDKFKRVNDSFGHAAGDQLLRMMGQRLANQLRPQDILARFGGDEFIAVMPRLPAGSGAAIAQQCGERVVAALAQPFDLSHHAIGVSASIGIAIYPQHGGDAETLVRNADIAVVEAKKAGRNELRFFNDAMNAAAKDALVMDGALRGAIEAGEFHLVYQPITHANGRQLRKIEALLRWDSALLGVVPPDRFIPVAEDNGMVVALGAWVLQQACAQVAAWRGGALEQVTISINVSAWQLVDPGFVALVEAALERNRLAPRQLELELTERVLLDDDGGTVSAVLERLRAMGVCISLDDFGTGYSSLSYLTQFHLNTLKIDRAFVMDIERSERSHNLVHAIIAMGHSLGLQLVAEGVETEGQAAILEGMGCQYLQGYHIARPIAPPELLRFAAGHGVRPAADDFVI
jgi:diguanylate cyclase (GGDEF)-like protein/PAS domain S-box-containing protein